MRRVIIINCKGVEPPKRDVPTCDTVWMKVGEKEGYTFDRLLATARRMRPDKIEVWCEPICGICEGEG